MAEPPPQPAQRTRPGQGSATRLDPDLVALAEACGVAVGYEDWERRWVDVAPETIQRVLGGLGVDAADPAAALQRLRVQRWRRLVAPCVVVRQSAPEPVLIRVPRGLPAQVRIVFQRAGGVDLPAPGDPVEHSPEEPPSVAGKVAVPVALPPGMPLGEHRLVVTAGEGPGRLEADARLIVAPDRIPLPDERLWGWMVQLYALRSAGSWGMGDYADLAALADWGGRGGAGAVLVNPLHASAPSGPVQDSPYYPGSRRFFSPLYLRPQTLPEYAAAPDEVRAEVEQLAQQAAAASVELIDREQVWAAKRRALELLFPYRVPRRGADDSHELVDFATWCALADDFGPDWHDWPTELHDPHGAAVMFARRERAERVEFHTWLQHCCTEQLAEAHEAALGAGMAVGIIHDLAVGVDPGGADAWALQADLAQGFTIGAPPDGFNQQGQDWRLPPWRPDRLAETAYQPIRDMVRAVLRAGGGLRVDHVLGLFRLWWVPEGASVREGTYVTYDADALLGVVALEAARAGGLVVGEDLGTVPPQVRDELAERGILGTTVLWFARDEEAPTDDGQPPLLPPQRWRELSVATVTTHDLPTAAGFLAGEHVRVRRELGLLNDPDAEAERAAAERAELLELLRAEGLLDAAAGEDEVIPALHLLLTHSPARVVLAGLPDAVGDRRQPNLPGTTDAYPNWRLPIADADGRPLSWEELRAHPQVRRLAEQLTRALRGE